MVNAVDSIGIRGMKQSDFEQLEDILHHFINHSDCYWGRKDYFDARTKRLMQWLYDVNHNLADCLILPKE